MTDRALSFGSGAADYERHRPGYPEHLVEHVLDYADRAVRTALEIGAGTGKATRVFAAAGIDVLATDPDAGMLAELRLHVPDTVRTRQAAFKDLDGLGTFDLVFAAAALHWTDPADRWSRVASLLVDGGIFASFGGQVEIADDAVRAAVARARAPFLDSDEVPSPDSTPHDAALQWPGAELDRSAEFTDIRQVVIERRPVMTAADYLGHLSTISAYRVLADDVRAQAFARIAEVLPGDLALTADLVLHLARRA